MPASRRTLTDAERLDWLRLSRSENVGPVTFRQLLGRFGSAGAALAALPELARRGGLRKSLTLCPQAAAAREVAALAALGARLVAGIEPDYPEALAALDDAPPLLAVLGDPGVFRRPAVAVVGARNASANGMRLAETLARELGAAGFVVVSGLARGIDGAAHRGSLDSGTVAVLAGGIDVVYPPENEALHRAIAGRGALIAEQPQGTQPQARHFPYRNRLISGLALGVVVVEAALRSGSLITARLALEQGREVFAVPGSPLDPRSRGANDLLRQGAVLVETAADVLAALEGMTRPSLTEPPAPDFAPAGPAATDDPELGEARERIESLLGPTPVAVDELLRRCQVSAPVVGTVLLELELAGRLERHPGHRVSLLLTTPAHVP
ncbi:MAG: DNA-processing protein DprA [Dongiaceae bacterium]